MPGTRAQSRGRGVGGSSSTADGNLPAAVPSPELTADSVLASDQGDREMSEVVPKDLQDPQIMILRASVTKSRKDLDNISAEIDEQVGLIKTAMEKTTPETALMQFKRSLKDLI